MIKSLYHVIRRVIEPKYPWIKDFVWTHHYTDGREYYSLELTVDKDFYYNNEDRASLYHKLYDDVKMLFNMVGPEDYMYFDDITVVPED